MPPLVHPAGDHTAQSSSTIRGSPYTGYFPFLCWKTPNRYSAGNYVHSPYRNRMDFFSGLRLSVRFRSNDCQTSKCYLRGSALTSRFWKTKTLPSTSSISKSGSLVSRGASCMTSPVSRSSPKRPGPCFFSFTRKNIYLLL